MDLDFDLSALKGREDDDSFATELFASSNYFQNEDRHPMDDIQSLVFSMWYVAGIPMSRSPNEEPEGSILSDCIENGEAKSRMMVIVTDSHSELVNNYSFIELFFFFRKNVDISQMKMFAEHSSLFALRK